MEWYLLLEMVKNTEGDQTFGKSNKRAKSGFLKIIKTQFHNTFAHAKSMLTFIMLFKQKSTEK